VLFQHIFSKCWLFFPHCWVQFSKLLNQFGKIIEYCITWVLVEKYKEYKKIIALSSSRGQTHAMMGAQLVPWHDRVLCCWSVLAICYKCTYMGCGGPCDTWLIDMAYWSSGSCIGIPRRRSLKLKPAGAEVEAGFGKIYKHARHMRPIYNMGWAKPFPKQW